MKYNKFVSNAFAQPKYVLVNDLTSKNLLISEAGERERGVWFKLIFDPLSHTLQYKVYGSPFAIAAAEWLSGEVADKHINTGQKLDLEKIRELLDMPYPDMNNLLVLEDAWLGLSS